MKIKEVIFIFLILAVFIMPFSSAGVGIKWNIESVVLNEGGQTCMTYGIYNPWPDETYAVIELSNNLKEVLISQEIEATLIPAYTMSVDAIPIEFCFKIPEIYEKDCILGIMCKKDCEEEQKVFSGEVIVKSVPAPTEISGAGGSATQMAVSAPLRLRVLCEAHGRDFTIIYGVVALISLGVILYLLKRKNRESKLERDRKKLKKLQEQIRKEKKKK